MRDAVNAKESATAIVRIAVENYCGNVVRVKVSAAAILSEVVANYLRDAVIVAG